MLLQLRREQSWQRFWTCLIVYTFLIHLNVYFFEINFCLPRRGQPSWLRAWDMVLGCIEVSSSILLVRLIIPPFVVLWVMRLGSSTDPPSLGPGWCWAMVGVGAGVWIIKIIIIKIKNFLLLGFGLYVLDYLLNQTCIWVSLICIAYCFLLFLGPCLSVRI